MESGSLFLLEFSSFAFILYCLHFLQIWCGLFQLKNTGTGNLPVHKHGECKK